VSNRPSKILRYLLTGVALLAVVVVLAGIKGAQIGSLIAFGKKAEAAGPPPEAVGVARAEEQAWEGTISAVGSVAAGKGVSVSNEAPGTVTRILFESGALVKEGQTLVELDTSVERAQLASALSRKELATTTAGRSRALVEKAAISQAQADNDENVLKTSKNEAETIQAQIARKTVRAPFTGKLGIRQVNVGQYLTPGTAITVLESLDKLFVDFTLPQQRLADVAVGMAVRVELDGAKGPPMEGVIAALDPTVDNITRTIKLRATLPSGGDTLRSGMFVDVRIVRPEKKTAVTVPATAVVHAPYGDSVFVVEDRKQDAPGPSTTQDGKPIKNARQQFVKIGESRGDFVTILDGVKAGQEIVAIGAFKLRNNAPVFVGDVAGPKPALDPKPQNR
jgi:membrane fusion protein (multidrug efflux system)